MDVPTLLSPPPATTPPWQPLRRLVATALARERRLTLYALCLLALALPMAVAWGLDGRVLRGANVWIKPIKFTLSIALLALTTAWFIGHLRPDRRRGPAIDRIVWLLVATGSLELAYITVQAALGRASHFNVGDPLHATLYALMGVGALALTATQPMLAWQLHRHADPARPPAVRRAVQLGLVLTFVLGAGVGMLLSGRQPPAGGAAVPLLGWQLAGGDLRPAHFVGIHAAQVLPLAGLWAAARGGARAPAWVGLAAAAYVGLFALLLAWGLARPAA